MKSNHNTNTDGKQKDLLSLTLEYQDVDAKKSSV